MFVAVRGQEDQPGPANRIPKFVRGVAWAAAQQCRFDNHDVGTPISCRIDRVSELMNDRDDRDIGLNLQTHSYRPAKQFVAQRNDHTDARVACRRRRGSSLAHADS